MNKLEDDNQIYIISDDQIVNSKRHKRETHWWFRADGIASGACGGEQQECGIASDAGDYSS
ncbi:MAG TPA: hypothetical protein VGB07_23920 [Blastocatellia bacterium]